VFGRGALARGRQPSRSQRPSEMQRPRYERKRPRMDTTLLDPEGPSAEPWPARLALRASRPACRSVRSPAPTRALPHEPSSRTRRSPAGATVPPCDVHRPRERPRLDHSPQRRPGHAPVRPHAR
jgi:hypothetical protein